MLKSGYSNIVELIVLFSLPLLFLTGCQNRNPETEPENWVNMPVSQWPDFALTNTVRFTDTTFTGLANAFLVNTGYDTIAVTCKHIFLVFKNIGLRYIDPGDDITEWSAFPKGQPEKKVVFSEMINKDSTEEIGEFNTLKDRDWLIFRLKTGNSGIYPLKVRTTPLKKGETVYAVGWSTPQKTKVPALVRMQVFENHGNYCYITAPDDSIEPQGRSGSPVIDTNGHLVGLVSGAEGELGVIAAVPYLVSLFDKYGIKYTK